ncbi:YheC/YheD family protein [Staphylospora marina]|uniref:YheC/YheD family protein n=1 Tax=Staphylospora marina TaxID=2490858 RepID=UPI000F5BFD52|nr:YheC/YheD family protein [Staphylospora marina]
MADTVGVLISRRVFSDSLRGLTPYESLELYDKHARREGMIPVFFTLDRILFSRRLVRAYERGEDGGYRERWVPVPRVIHNRVKPPAESPEFRMLKRLPGIRLFNRDNRFDKWNVHCKLKRTPELCQHLPRTHPLTWKRFCDMFEEFGDVIIKPRDKSLGMDLVRIDRTEGGVRVRKASGMVKEMSGEQLRRFVRARESGGAFLVQQAIPLMEKKNRPFDLRVSVQRGGDGRFRVSGIVAKVGLPGAAATNVAVGGEAEPVSVVLREAGVSGEERLLREISRVALHAADCLAGEDLGIADLGMDLGIDKEGRIWIIEVNGRDLRVTFHCSGDMEAWERTFATPMMFARHLLDSVPPAKDAAPSVAILTPGNLPVYGSGSGSVEISARSVFRSMQERTVTWLLGTGTGNHPSAVEIRASGRKEYLKRAIQALRRLAPDVIQIENRPLWIRNVSAALPAAGKVLFMHSETYLNPPYAADDIERHLAGYDLIIANSRFLADRLHARYPCLGNKVRVVRLGVNLKQFRPPSFPEERERIRRSFGFDPQAFIILFVGRLIPGKGVHHLVEAFSRMADERPDAVLLIVGGSHYGYNLGTPYVKQLKRMAKPLRNCVFFKPFTRHSRLPSIYRMADVLVTPSVCDEAFGLVNLEGMASGLPVLSTCVGGIPEVVEDGVTGRLLPTDRLSERIAETLSDWMNQPGWLREMGEAGRRRAEKRFTWERTAKKLALMYRVLTAR